MDRNTKEKFGKIFYKGRLVDIDEMTTEERQKIIEELEAESEELGNKIDKILGIDK